MEKYLMTVAFRGTRYHGFQVQQNAVTVCQVFQDAVEEAFGVRYPVKSSSRTDAGVHASGLVLVLEAEETLEPEAMLKAINNRLPADIAVRDCRLAPEGFHPRYSCLGKRYLYKIWNSPVKNPFMEDLAWHIRHPIDAALADEAARAFVGTRDFSSLCAAGGDVEDKVRTIYNCYVEREGDLLTLAVTGDGFLYNMVRILTGTLIEVCAGKLAVAQIPKILGAMDRSQAGPTAPPQGLYLDAVFYEAAPLALAISQGPKGR